MASIPFVIANKCTYKYRTKPTYNYIYIIHYFFNLLISNKIKYSPITIADNNTVININNSITIYPFFV
jgi:hypothetical protein